MWSKKNKLYVSIIYDPYTPYRILRIYCPRINMHYLSQISPKHKLSGIRFLYKAIVEKFEKMRHKEDLANEVS